MRAPDAGGAPVGESAAWMLRSRLHGWIYADPTGASAVTGADQRLSVNPNSEA